MSVNITYVGLYIKEAHSVHFKCKQRIKPCIGNWGLKVHGLGNFLFS